MILIDEPELNLHPALQQRFIEQLSEFSPNGMIFATHSLGLARSCADKIYSFKKQGSNTTVCLYERTPNLVEFLGEMGFAAHAELGYDRILLVEGVHDIKVFRQFLRIFGLEHKTVVLFLGGNQMATGDREHELSEIKRLTDRVYAIADSEREHQDGSPDAKRLAFEASCEKLKIPVQLTKFRATENYFSDRAVKEALGNSYSALGPYENIKNSANGWAKADNWKIAAKMNIKEIQQTDIGAFIRDAMGD